ncbi:MAG TPA: UDP-glucose 4-epimerase GalE [Stellaceae bacterium]|jgi:UDP-arabinose 4-epimerase|nr:UDP-glucose 4-epimerase GalE [Stellaceae bacterium]
MMGKSILVTGGAGYIGSHACKALAKAGYEPVAYDNLIYGHKEAVRWGPFVEGDIGDREKVAETIRRHDIGAVMHFAAFAYVGESVEQPEKYFRNNVVNTLAMLEAMRTTGVKQIVFSSTCATYGLPEKMPIREDTPQHPVNPYGETKLMVERMLHWYGIAHGLRSVALRYFNAAGADPEGEIGEDHNPETHLIPLILDAAAGRRAHIGVFGSDYPTPDGSAVRDYIHVQDLADAHIRALGYLGDGGESRAFNLGTGHGHSVRETIEAARRVTGRPIPSKDSPRRAGDPPVLVADAGAAREKLGWMPALGSLEHIIGTAWAWHQKRFNTKEGTAP